MELSTYLASYPCCFEFPHVRPVPTPVPRVPHFETCCGSRLSNLQSQRYIRIRATGLCFSGWWILVLGSKHCIAPPLIDLDVGVPIAISMRDICLPT
jgi:hypothetical protein